jgi:hypothetical protein
MCRIGILSYLYQQRFEVAYYFNLIKEVPMALCGSDYKTPHEDLVILDQQEDGQIPASLTSSEEIILFFQGSSFYSPQVFSWLNVIPITPYQVPSTCGWQSDLLRPPAA